MFQLEMLIPELPSVKFETYEFTRSWRHLSNSRKSYNEPNLAQLITDDSDE